MKNAEGVDLPAELDRRLKRGVDQLRQFREAVEELDQIADAIGPLLGVERPRRRGKGASRTSPTAAEAQTPSAASKAPSTASAAQPEDIPEWRKVFPGLSARVPGSKK
ncbi:hypothetical protein [Archangium sp.]|uniref:hypothetical protein n=1 Tax=Archangium sp. TaxID=1872627 RepID=UPI00286A06F5|nr:hypothetical protein [Archangium sp.]